MAFIGKARQVQRFEALWQQTASAQPALLAWMSRRPLQALDLADRIHVLADSSKLGRAAQQAWAPLERPWTLITDAGADDAQLAPFRALPGVTVLLAAR